ncbi:malonyl-CoA-acyl carrier protein transacylase, mitochondrial isoform X2 [Crotalus tigris]|uniref:malonyl-CoA-acyl carrier protein transacylase, mitochondrial isoform X2 n=1 Tax=Crotalus tigris TaxID=88082 RepID=UPI00192F5730|nr:malonyl-CoA-acyl carrier protein transacylase, mitochondrial isoform X2 [Crotalus tigris]
MFLSHVISHLDRYAQHYPSQWAMVMAVSAGLQGEAAAWAADLYSDHARELANTGLFLDALRAHFEDITRAQHAEAELLALRQHGRRATDYVREFRRVAGRLRSWPERLLVHQFRAGLDRELHQACVLRGVPSRLQDWFRVVIDLDTGLQEFWGKGEEPLIPGRPLAKLWEEGRRGPPADVGSSAPSARVPFRCFRCNQPGHRAADCPAPSPQAPSSAPGKPTPRANKTPDTSRAAQQPEAGTSQQSVPKEEEEEATAATRYRLVADDSDDDIANDPMVLESCVAAAGFSIGEYAALVFAGAMDYAEALYAVKTRAEAMQEASEVIASGMLSVIGRRDSNYKAACLEACEYCKSVGIEDPVCEVSNYLFPDSRVIAGHLQALEFLQKNSRKFSFARVKMLPVSGAFHTRLMKSAMQPLSEALESISIQQPLISVYSNVDSKKYMQPGQIQHYLVEQLVSPVKWEQIMHRIYERNQGKKFPYTYEVGPGKQLGAILRSCNLKASRYYSNIDVSEDETNEET